MSESPRIYTIFVCPACGDGPRESPYLPGVGPRGDADRRCGCGFKGGFVPLHVTAATPARIDR